MIRFDAKAQALVIDGAVEFLGNLDNAKLLRWMAACDCLLNTSRENNTPIFILAALALGVPVVSTAAFDTTVHYSSKASVPSSRGCTPLSTWAALLGEPAASRPRAGCSVQRAANDDT